MTTDHDFDRIASDWLVDGPVELSDRVYEAAFEETHRTRQRQGGPLPRRVTTMVPKLALATAAAAIVLAAVILVPRSPGPAVGGPGPGGSPSASVRPSASLVAGIPYAPSTPLPSPSGDPLPETLVGREYRLVGEEVPDGDPRLILSLRPADDPHCVAMFGGTTTCFTILWDPPRSADRLDPGARGAAVVRGEDLVLEWYMSRNDRQCENTEHVYRPVDGGAVLRGVDVPSCGFPDGWEQRP